MKTISFLFVVALAAIVPNCPAFAQANQSYNYGCVTGCSTLATLRLNATAHPFISVAGYYTPGDGGGGDFYLVSGSSPCVSWTSSSGSGQVGHQKITGITLPMTGTPQVGELVSVTGTGIQSQPGTQLASINGTTIILTLPLTGTASGSTPVSETFSGDNGGTLIIDTIGDCYQKAHYRGEPHEWGAKGDGTTDDTTDMQRWLGAYGNLSNLAPTNPPNQFGPWIATIPAIYNVSSPLYCPQYANLWAPANDSHPGGNQPSPIVQIKPAGTGSFTSGEAIMTAQLYCRITGLSIDAVNVASSSLQVNALNISDFGVVVDGHAEISGGWNNLSCTVTGAAGLQVKDSQFGQSWADDIYIPGCSNVRLIGDVVSSAGGLYSCTTGPPCPEQAAINFQSEELTLSNGILENSSGPGLYLKGADLASVTGMYFNTSGAVNSNSAGVEIDNANQISICGNHFKQNDQNPGTGAVSAHVRFGGTASQSVTLCGNVYREGSPTLPAVPTQYDYDILSTNTPTITSFYESPQMQSAGIYSLNAQTSLQPYLQYSPGFPNNYLTGLTLSYSGSFPSVVNITVGQAADSTNSTVMSLSPALSPPCSVNLNSGGLGGLDVGPMMAASSTTYFFFLVSQYDGSGVSCMASASPTPSFTYYNMHFSANYGLYRMIGALYTTSSMTITVVPFVEDGDTFYLNTPEADINNSLGSSLTNFPLASVPYGIVVEALGRCVGTSISGGNTILLSTPPVAPGAPAAFPTPPGYSFKTATSSGLATSFRYRLHTDAATDIAARATGTGSTLQCMTDGWVFHRGP